MKTVLITGGAKRIGKSIALFFAKNGYDIILHYFTSEEEALNTKKEIESFNVKCSLLKLDFSTPGAGTLLLDMAYKISPEISCIVNNASIFYPDKNDVDNSKNRAKKASMLQINFYLPLRVMQGYVNREKSGIIINMIDGKIDSYGIEFLVYKLSKQKLLDETIIAAENLKENFKIFGIMPHQILPPSINGKVDETKKYNVTGTESLLKIFSDIINKKTQEVIISC